MGCLAPDIGDCREVIAFQETAGMTAAEIYAAIEVDDESALPDLGHGHVDVTGVRGTLRAGGAVIPIEGMELILPWPVRR